MSGMKHLFISMTAVLSLTALTACDCASCNVDKAKDAVSGDDESDET